MPVFSIRCPQSLVDSLNYEAQAQGVSRNQLIRHLLVTQLPTVDEDVTQRVTPEPVTQVTFRCPITGCEFAAPSPKAVCGAHGRTVVEAS